MAEIAEMQEPEVRRSSLEEPAGKPVKEKEKRKLYRRSHSLAEIRRPTHVFLPEGKNILKCANVYTLSRCLLFMLVLHGLML